MFRNTKISLRPASLWQRTFFFILVPTFLLLLIVSVGCYVFVRNLLLHQWGETAIAELQRTAHHIDMRLRQPKDLLNLVQTDKNATGVDQAVLSHILQRIKGLDGVVGVNLNKPGDMGRDVPYTHARPSSANVLNINLPRQLITKELRYNYQPEDRTVSLNAYLQGKEGNSPDRVEVILSFDLLIDHILQASWWKSNKAFLIDDSGNVLASTTSAKPDSQPSPAILAFGSSALLERDTLEAIAKKSFGTVFGAGIPPDEISGFYRLAEAPWTMVIIAPGNEVLRPIIRFKTFYVISFAICIPLVLLFILGMTNRVTTRIKALSAAADSLARGNFGPPLEITAVDEVGELTGSFNKMTSQLQHRLALQEAMNIAGEVQKNLLPLEFYTIERITVGGICLYCDETGGDYYDILQFAENDRKVGVVVGDVVGHGIGAALLMTTVRALLRCRVSQPGDLGQVMNDVNRLLLRDTVKQGNFVTLFYLQVNYEKNSITWVRCGHDPAIIFTPATGHFTELMGPGMPLGVIADCDYQCNEIPLAADPHCILIYSDGAWEVENEAGEKFGKERLKTCLAESYELDVTEMLTCISERISAFRGIAAIQDDITLAVVKIS